MFPPSDRSKPIVKALLAYPDAGTEADHLEIFRGVAQIVRSTVGDRQQLGDLLHPVNERGVSDGFAGLVRRFYGRGSDNFIVGDSGAIFKSSRVSLAEFLRTFVIGMSPLHFSRPGAAPVELHPCGLANM